jgi:hypothetical protein
LNSTTLDALTAPTKYICVLVEKSPGDPRRKGDVMLQDWAQQVVEAARFYESFISENRKNLEFWVVSATHLAGLKPATEYYLELARKLGLPLKAMPLGYETIGQLREADNLAQSRQNARLVLISTATHARRVRWICKRENIFFNRLIVAHGIPNPQERLTDPIMDIAYPVLDSVGLLNRFLTKVIERRKNGKL